MTTAQTKFLLLILVILLTGVFWVSDLDLYVTGLFYAAEQNPNWPAAQFGLFSFFHKAAPAASLSVLVLSLVIIVSSLFNKHWAAHRRAAFFILAVFVVGPGLIVNSIFKDHWGRPRPDQTVHFGGTEPYIPPLLYHAEGSRKAKSFPSGHSSVGFAFFAFWFLLRNKHKRLARIVFWGTLLLGSLMGLARIADGAHYLSDVLWSAIIPISVAFLLHKIFYRHEYQPEERNNSQKAIGRNELIIISITVIALTINLLSFPVDLKIEHKDFKFEKHIEQVCYVAENSTVKIRYAPIGTHELHRQQEKISLRYEGKGFGLIGSEATMLNTISDNRLYLEFKTSGTLSEWHSKAELTIHSANIPEVILMLDDGQLLSPAKTGLINSGDKVRVSHKSSTEELTAAQKTACRL